MQLGALLPGLKVQRLAVSGSTSAEVREQQLPQALAARPVLASVLVGLNDVLRTRCDRDELVENLGGTLSTLRYAGVSVLIATLHDPTGQLHLPKSLARRVSQRVATVNDVVRAAAADDPGIRAVDLATEPRLAAGGAWASDRVHLSVHGHTVLAAVAARALGIDAPPVPAPPPGPGALRHLHWLLTSGTFWFVNGGARRSLPFLNPTPAEPR